MSNEVLTDELRRLLGRGRKLEAVKLYKDRTGASLMDAKKAVEALAREDAVPPEKPRLVDEAVQAQLRELLNQGRKLDAVKLYRERTGVGLLDAKNAVEALQPGAPTAASSPVPERVAADLLPALRMGDLREAVRVYRQRTGAGSREARRAVRALARQHALYDRESALLTLVPWLLVVLGLALLVMIGFWALFLR